MKKKLLSLVLAAGMVMSLVACGGTGEGNNSENGSEAKTENGTENGAAQTPGQPDENGNYVINGGFEAVDFEGWTVTNIDNVTEELDVYTRETDCMEGVQSLHFYSGSSNVNFTAEQTITGLEAGNYKLTGNIQGDAAGDENAEIFFYAIIDGEKTTVEGVLTGYVNWNTAELSVVVPESGEITIGVSVKTAPGGWGTIDGITLVKE